MKRLVLAAVLSLAALPVWGYDTGFATITSEVPPLAVPQCDRFATHCRMILIGFGANAEPITARCAIAIGDEVVVHGSNRLAVAGDPDRPIYRIGLSLRKRIGEEIKRVKHLNRPVSFAYDAVKGWNRECGFGAAR